ncbi:hypothetical protein [Enterococcus hirae]|uniref:hypothetical protein n=1 Tax=Enterococcus TaxID=1350 RepID=UPI0004D437CF|nr:hypothetical protein [Enterococcus hirae]KDR93350.1 hypothetical protein EI18_05820 [Enterococcus hirae]QQB25234.1 hypothetical protein I6I14_00095 [Enterococcus hirae]STD80462.1 Uncharacterised protein [Enterococcus hirae]
MFTELDRTVEYLHALNEGDEKERLLSEFCFNEQEIQQIKSDIERIENDNFESTTEKGHALENLAKSILSCKNLFEVDTNLHSSTNEVDLSLKLKPGSQILLNSFFPRLSNLVYIGECKNYNKKIDVTWIGKVHSLICLHNFDVCLLFSKHGFTGRKWNAGSGLSRKIALRENRYIIDINFKDLEKLKEISILELIHAKYSEIIHDIDYAEYLSKHPAEEIK